jgi:antitoxin component of RelBE/YafQ-DinJ toxin-antitoxin module
VKETYVRARISQVLKDRLTAQLAKDGLSESDFILSRVIAYLEQREQDAKEQD